MPAENFCTGILSRKNSSSGPPFDRFPGIVESPRGQQLQTVEAHLVRGFALSCLRRKQQHLQ